MSEKKEKKYIIDNPVLMAEWDWDMNNKQELHPEQISVSSQNKVWWKCESCGESFLRRVADMKKPYCSKCTHFFKTIKNEQSLGVMHPKLLEEWDYNRNTISPYEIKPHYNGKVYWICKKHKTSFFCTPDYRICHNYGGCLECKKETLSELRKKPKKGLSFIEKYNDIIEKYYDFTQNTDIDLSNVSYKSNRKVNWKCKKCGTTWISKFQIMAEGRKCPKCETKKFKSFPEQCIFYYTQYYFNNTIWGYKDNDISELDIFLPDKRIAIEYDGEYYHKQIRKDINKDNICKRKGIKLIRVREPNCPKYKSETIMIYRHRSDCDDNYIDLNNVIQTILTVINDTIKYDINIERDLSIIRQFSLLQETKNSLESNYPLFAKYWDSKINGTIRPSMVAQSSDKEYYFICETCGKSFKRRIASLIRANACECEICARKRAQKNRAIAPIEKSIGYLYPYIADELLNDKNKGIDIYGIYSGSQKKYFWKCKNCGNIYEMSVNNRVNGHLCPKCATENRKLKRGKKVICVETKEIFNSISEASRLKKVCASEICKCCKDNTKTASGYHWRYAEES